MKIDAKHIASKKRIGTSKDGHPVVELLLKGGLVLVTTVEDGKPKVISAGPHRAVARFMAEKQCDGLKLDELSKSEKITEAGYESVREHYEAIRDNWNAMLSKLTE